VLLINFSSAKPYIMKKSIVLVTVIIALFTNCYCQKVSTTDQIGKQYTSNDYLIKAKKQKTAAWVCLGGGLAMATTGAALSLSKASNDIILLFIWDAPATTTDYTGETILLFTGVAGMLTSIPLFIASSKNKQRAKISVTSQKTVIGLPTVVPKSITGLTVSISL
jgi:hypothetical protein